MTRREARYRLILLLNAANDNTGEPLLLPEEEEAITTALEALKQPEQKQGKWIGLGEVFECSVCHERSCCTGNYCPDCGAKMEEEK